MPIASIVVALEASPELRRGALDWLSSDPRVEKGTEQRGFLPIVVSTQTAGEGADLVENEAR